MANDILILDDGNIRIDLTARSLHVNGHRAKLSGRAFDMLTVMLKRRGQIVSKQELLDAAWPGLVVEENNLHVHIMSLRKVLGPQAIVTVSGRGYQCVLAAEGASRERNSNIPTTSTNESGARGRSRKARAPLIGRESLIASIGTLMRREDVRLASLVGPGGSGKTRLALRVTSELAGEFTDGTCVVMLAPVRDVAHVASAINTVLSIQEIGDRRAEQLLLSFLGTKSMLLTLDNFEHLHDASSLVTRLLAECPRLKILITSRRPLGVPLEHVIAVPALALPEPLAGRVQSLRSPALQMFLERALATEHPIGDAHSDIDAAIFICRHLDGLPLAMELAAARLRMLSPVSLAERLRSRQLELKNDASEVPTRQQTLRNAIDWSYDLLDDVEKEIFRCLAVFVGGWSLEQAEAIVKMPGGPTILDAVSSLVNHSLVQRIDDVDGEPRFAMLETVREFAFDLLTASAQVAELRQRHAAWFADLAEVSESYLKSAARGRWITRLKAEYHNLQAALSWCATEQSDASLSLRLVGALPWHWYFSGRYREGLDWIEAALALPGAEQNGASRARVLSGASRLATYSGAIRDAIDYGRQSVAMFRKLDDRPGLALALIHQAIPMIGSADRLATCAMLEESEALFHAMDDKWGIALAVTYHGIALSFKPGTEDAARPLLMGGRARFRVLGDDWGVTTSSHYLGSIAMRQANFAMARELTEEMLLSARGLGDDYRVSRTLHQLAEIELADGKPSRAAEYLRDSIALNRAQGRIGDIAQQLRFLARIEAMESRFERSVRLYAAAANLRSGDLTLPPDDPGVHHAALETARSSLDPWRFESEWTLGAVMPLEQVLDWVLSPSTHNPGTHEFIQRRQAHGKLPRQSG